MVAPESTTLEYTPLATPTTPIVTTITSPEHQATPTRILSASASKANAKRAGTTTVSPSSSSTPLTASSPNGSMHTLVDQLSTANLSELASLSSNVLIEIVVKQQREREEMNERWDRAEKDRIGMEKEMRYLEMDFIAAKGRVDQLMLDEGRMEEELSGRIEVLDKLRTSIRESEREQREAKKRYREQTDSFDSERQSWYDQEQHYKLRITNLSNTTPRRPRISDVALDATAEPQSSPTPSMNEAIRAIRATTPSRPDSTSAVELLALQEQLSSLTTAHHSLTATSRALQVELGELKRVYSDLQEENESYELLLSERTMNGEVRESALMNKSWASDDDFSSGAMTLGGGGTGANSSYGGGLESVGETDETTEDDDDEVAADDSREMRESELPKITRGKKSISRKRSSTGGVGGVATRGLGLDLAAELEAAELADEESETLPVQKVKKHKRSKSAAEMEVLRGELKSLREANKALTLYVSKIVDRVCSQEGFEKVLAVDFKTTPDGSAINELADSPIVPLSSTSAIVSASTLPVPQPVSKTRYHASTTSESSSSRLFRSTPSSAGSSSQRLSDSSTPAAASSASATTSGKRVSPPVIRVKQPSTRPLSLDWKSVSSVFAFSRSGSTATPTPPYQPTGFKPLILVDHTATSAIGAVRHLPTDEDEDDHRERERLRAEMALHGIETSAAGWGKPSIERGLSMSSSNGSTSGGGDRKTLSIEEKSMNRRSTGSSNGGGVSPRILSMSEEGGGMDGSRRPSATTSDASSDYPEVQFRRRTTESGMQIRSPTHSPLLRPDVGSRKVSWETSGSHSGDGLGLSDVDMGELNQSTIRADSTVVVSEGEGITWTKRLKRMSLAGGWTKVVAPESAIVEDSSIVVSPSPSPSPLPSPAL